MTIFIGMTVFNGERHLRSALVSLLDQTHRDFTLVIVDDGSRDSSVEIITEFEKKDSRIRVIKHCERNGAIAAWKRAFDYALEQNAKFFAWASDHDLWDTRWLELLSQTIQNNEHIALVYPQTIRIDDNGRQLNLISPKFETKDFTVENRIRKLRNDGHGYGDMIYGLFRMSYLKKTGIYRRLLLPDTVTIWEISLIGMIVQIHKGLWYRRYVDLFSIERQKRTLFLVPPWYTHLPYWLVNPITIAIQRPVNLKDCSTINAIFVRLLLGLSYGITFGLLELKRSVKSILRCIFTN